MNRNLARMTEWTAQYRFREPIYVTRPSMPPLGAYCEKLEGIWQRQWLTNAGELHQELERRLAAYLDVDHLSLFCNGTIALLVALQSLRINSGEVITTPFTFPATPHVLYWNHIRPVFCDIEDRTFNLDPAKIEPLIGPDTKAILPVHVFGNPCDVDAIQRIADRHGLHVIYDAAHAFGVRHGNRSLAACGDLSVLSFHATKLFSTIEGGAVVSRSLAEKQRIDYLKNFGIASEEKVIGPGINGKMNEFQAAFGLLQLDMVEAEIAARGRLTAAYRAGLHGAPGVSTGGDIPGVTHNYAYFPVMIDAAQYGMDRDELHDALKAFNIFARKYFHPLCSHFPCYTALSSAQPSNLPVAERVAREILCLPLYATLPEDAVETICTVIRLLQGSSGR